MSLMCPLTLLCVGVILCVRQLVIPSKEFKPEEAVAAITKQRPTTLLTTATQAAAIRGLSPDAAKLKTVSA